MYICTVRENQVASYSNSTLPKEKSYKQSSKTSKVFSSFIATSKQEDYRRWALQGPWPVSGFTSVGGGSWWSWPSYPDAVWKSSPLPIGIRPGPPLPPRHPLRPSPPRTATNSNNNSSSKNTVSGVVPVPPEPMSLSSFVTTVTIVRTPTRSRSFSRVTVPNYRSACFKNRVSLFFRNSKFIRNSIILVRVTFVDVLVIFSTIYYLIYFVLASTILRESLSPIEIQSGFNVRLSPIYASFRLLSNEKSLNLFVSGVCHHSGLLTHFTTDCPRALFLISMNTVGRTRLLGARLISIYYFYFLSAASFWVRNDED